MSDSADVRLLLGIIASHRVLPPPGVLPPDSEELRAALAEIAQGSRSIHAALIVEVATSRHLAVEDLVRRAGFVLACVALPPTGTHYELLGVSPTASSREIRQRWSALIQRYHPDHAGSEGGLGDQARRLIEAYQTLRDPGRRRRYNADLARGKSDWQVVMPVEAPGSWRKLRPSARWRWAPAVIVAVGVIVVIARWTSHQHGTTSRPASRPSSAVVGEPPAELREPILVESPRAPVSSGLRDESDTTASPPAAPAALLPSLSARLAKLEPRSVAPAVEPVESADQRSGGERRERARADADGAPAVRGALAPAGSSLPSAEAAGRTPDRTGAETANPHAAPATRSAPPAAVDRTPGSPERVPPPRHDLSLPRRAIATAPPRADAQKPPPEAYAALIESFRDAYERRDLDALVQLFGPEVREGQTVGRSAVQHLYARNFRVLDGIRYEVFQVTAQSSPRDGEIIVHGRFRIRAVNLENRSRPLDVSGPIRWVIRREGEALRIVGIDYSTRER